MACLFSIGLLMVFDVTSAEVLESNLQLDPHYALIKQLIYAFISLFLAVILWFFGYQKFLKWIPFFYYATLFCLIAVFIPGIGRQLNGAYRWIFFGPISFQPSEIMKLIMPLMFIYFFEKKSYKLSWRQFYAIIAFFALPLCLILIEPDNGSVAILMVTMTVLFFLCRIPFAYYLFPLLILGTIGIFCAFQMSHVKQRIKVYLNPHHDRLGKGHQPYQAKIAAGSGRLLGKGIGQSVQKLNYLPTARSDYIAAIYAEEFGFIGIIFLVLLYMIITYIGFHMASFAKEKSGYYVGAISIFLISFQAFLNLGVVSGLLPSKGTNLPFFSQGGSSLIANTLALTLVLNVTKTLRKEKDLNLLCKNTN